MGASLTTATAILGVSLLIVAEIIVGNIIPTFSDVKDSYDKMKTRLKDQITTGIQITEVTQGPWWNASFSYRKRITLDATKVDSALANFPVLVNIIDTDLKSNVSQSNGNDIAFVTSEHSLQYNHEIELFNKSNGMLTAWVNLTSVSSHEDTVFYIYYGNASCESQENSESVWSSTYHMVQHVEETGTETRKDSTNNDYDGAPKNFEGDESTSSGKIDGANVLDGTDDWINISTGTELLNLSSSNASFFIWIKTSIDGKTIMSKTIQDDVSGNGDILLDIFSNKLHLEVESYGGVSGSTTITDDDWHQVGFTYNTGNGTIYLYVDGNLDGTSSYNISSYNTRALALGVFTYNILGEFQQNYFNGSIDEIRICNVIRNQSWINTSYLNQNSPSTFLNIGNQQIVDQVNLNVTVQNIGDVILDTSKVTILINGTIVQPTYSQEYLYPELELYSTVISNEIGRGSKIIKLVTENGLSDYYEYED
jgi:archaellum component FlaF (FlaF/FlaG flagellin family)